MRTCGYSKNEESSYKPRIPAFAKSEVISLSLISRTEKEKKNPFLLKKSRISLRPNYLKDNPTSFLKDKKFVVNPYI